MFLMNSKNIENSIIKLYKSVGDLTSKNYLSAINQIKLKREKMFK